MKKILILAFFLFDIHFAYSQVVRDTTLSSESSIVSSVREADKSVISISGGATRGANLFHSLNSFSVNQNEIVQFINPTSINRIITRITGSAPSGLDGVLRTNGQADLFILNKNGFSFGPNAVLDIGGSFVATTAQAIEFKDGTNFSTNINSAPPTLTVSTPLGLSFGNSVGEIRNRAIGDSISGTANISVPPQKTVALIGGNITFSDRGSLVARGGRIELGSVTPNSFVAIEQDLLGFKFDYSQVSQFGNISFNDSYLSVSNLDLAPGSGNINIIGRVIDLSNRSLIFSFNDGPQPSDLIRITAMESLSVDQESEINATTFSSAPSGNIIISTPKLFIRDLSLVQTRAFFASGQAGNIEINASEIVSIDTLGFLSSQSVDGGNSGNINIDTKKLVLASGGQISGATFFGAGNGGRITITATELLSASGKADFFGTDISSGIFSSSNDFASGNAGDLIINARNINISNGAQLSVSAIRNSIGKAGQLSVTSSRIQVSGSDSQILAISESPEAAGGINISSNKILINNDGQINVSSSGEGPAGSLTISSNLIRLQNRGSLRATTNNSQGNINLNTDALILLNESSITTNASNNASGGNIFIKAGGIAALNNSDITANAFDGNGGRVEINSKGIFGLTPRTLEDIQFLLGSNDPAQLDPSFLQSSDVTAISQQGGPLLEGTVTFQTPEIDPTQNLTVIPENIVDSTTLIGRNCYVKPGSENSDISSLVVTGRGGLPLEPSETTSVQSVMSRWVDSSPPITAKDGLPVKKPLSKDIELGILEANGWDHLPDGRVMLTSSSLLPSTGNHINMNDYC
ncbi:filamentous hemagglutinin N-terminal domain-containing protein [Acaryochloris sp. CCMEE 5410]|uniref:two-partner secretion domain-containing protein n=1 Tax=Acaryochloris sp. CCMEE 5410 TaxID=310037 RepID=UPI0002484369|nr:filamentous hemagglutinin N-terminal domain-containing protein [Acaryochloris sp. CCMEE 5410]KAI9132089.1 filamentous hemagglutinin N-terminal domain-containing protein [Acaryochloris sp. CCMEE 5410]